MSLLPERIGLTMAAITEWQKLDEKLHSHRWLIGMLSQMREYYSLNGLRHVSDVNEIAKTLLQKLLMCTK